MLTFCTGNKNKFSEVEEELGIPLKQYSHGYPEIQAETLVEVIHAGMDHLDPIIDGPYFLDDSGLFIKGLNGFPGVYSAYVFKTIGNRGILRLLRDKEGEERNAQFRTAVGYRSRNGIRHVVIGKADGQIIQEQRGENGFGYDPIFKVKGTEKTFAEMSQKEKNGQSHRGAAMRKMKNIIKEEQA